MERVETLVDMEIDAALTITALRTFATEIDAEIVTVAIEYLGELLRRHIIGFFSYY